MSTTNSMKLVFDDGQTTTEPIPVFDRDEIQSMTFMLGWTSVVLSKASPSAVEVVVHQLDQPPPPPPASEAENRTKIVVANEEFKHQEHEQGSTRSSGFITEQIKEMRGMLMIVATLLLQMSYQAGLNPPRGFWQVNPSTTAARSRAMTASSFAPAPLGGENCGDAVGSLPYPAGDPIMRSKNYGRYRRFEILNSMSLACSSVLIVILLALSLVRSRKVSRFGLQVAVNIMFVDLLSILAAYYIGAVTPENRIISPIPYFAVVVACGILYTLYKCRGRWQNN